jgi:2-polyprenyl-3-methyl-5-hydroxy-6-metoxy-1,4-benzoquinol methylase/glycosyltransferase involved in cell wall biosynthesis
MTSIGVAIITRNRIEQLRRLLPQLVKFDQVVIVDTGSQDGTEKYIRDLGRPYEYHKFPWRDAPSKKNSHWGFEAARNESFKHLKTTHALWLDTDDMIGVVKGKKTTFATADQAYGVFKRIAQEAPADIDVWFIKYVYSKDENGNPNTVHTRERLVKLSSGWRWVYPIHECLVPNQAPKYAEVNELDIVHLPGKVVGQSSERNMKMLRTWLEQLEQSGPHHDLARCRLNIGETYYALGQYQEAAKFLVGEFIGKHPESLDIEKWHAWVYVAKCQLELNNFEAARAAALACIDVEPGLADGYLLLGQVKLLTKADPQDVLLLMDAAGRAEEAPSQMITNPLDYTFTPRCIVSDCKFQLGQYQAALEWALKALDTCPNDMRAEQLRIQAADGLRRRDAVNSAKAVYQLLQDYEENEKAAKLYEMLPYVAQQDEEIIEVANEAANRVKHLVDRKEYIKLYQETEEWIPAQDKWILDEDPPGLDRYKWILGRLQKALPNGGTILDVGCGEGHHSLLYAKHGYQVVGVDIDPRRVQLANERAEKWNLDAKFIQGFFEDMHTDRMEHPFKPGRNWEHEFDAVVCSEVVEHVQDPAYLLGCLGDCAKDGAPILITTPDEAFDKGDKTKKDNHDAALHVRVYTQETFEALLKSNPEFNVVESHFVAWSAAYRDNQGWQCGEIRRELRPDGPVIRVYCTDRVDFTPDSLDKGGIGGSETAVVHMAHAWAKMGCQVVVYGSHSGIWDNVFYRPVSRFHPDQKSDVFISWRWPLMFENQRPNATTTILWMHDLFCEIQVPGYRPNEIPQSWAGRIDYVMVLSEFHKKWIAGIHPTLKDKIVVTRNGIDATRYVGKDIKKQAHRYFYSSSYDRGLEELLEIWPKIKEAIPDAELHVAYGTEVAEMIYSQTGNYDKLNHLYRLVNKMQALPGVVHYKRLGQKELSDIQLSCEAWLYPPQPNHPNGDGGFNETYAITAQEAQAARCMVVSRKNGALPETIKHAIWWDQTTDIVDILKNINSYWKPEWTEQNYKIAIEKTWGSLAIDWALMLKPKEVATV